MHVRQFRVEPSPLAEFERACQLFKSASLTNSRAARALVSVHQILISNIVC